MLAYGGKAGRMLEPKNTTRICGRNAFANKYQRNDLGLVVIGAPVPFTAPFLAMGG